MLVNPLLPDPWQQWPYATTPGKVDIISSLLKHSGGGWVNHGVGTPTHRLVAFCALGTTKYNYVKGDY